MSEQVTCPSCGAQVSDLRSLSEGLIRKLEEEGHTSVPPQVCENCYQKYAGSVARGAVLLAELKAREQKKLMMWKSRVNLIKKGRALMKERAYADAAIAYEKYLKVLETVYDCKPNEITPEHLKNTARTQELMVIASVYWDLMRIYDSSERYGSRMEMAAKKLSEFLPLTPLYPDIVKKAEAFQKTAKNPSVVKNFLKAVSERKGRCFVASSAFDSPFAPEVIALQAWRDNSLNRSIGGRVFIKLYYAVSPHLAKKLDENPQFKPIIRLGLCYFVKILSLTQLFSIASFFKTQRNKSYANQKSSERI
jgi:hypothetical protein